MNALGFLVIDRSNYPHCYKKGPCIISKPLYYLSNISHLVEKRHAAIRLVKIAKQTLFINLLPVETCLAKNIQLISYWPKNVAKKKLI